MSGFLLDTNCLLELVSLKPSPRVLDWFAAADEDLLYLSVLTLGAIRKGIAGLPNSKKRTRLATWLEVELVSRFRGRIIEVDQAVADRWGLLTAQAKALGTPLPVIDALLAATAVHHNLTLVSRNIRDFEPIQVSILNPWRA